MSREAALTAYRHLLRAARLAFQGDSYRLIAAREAARQGFEANRTLVPGSKEFTDSVDHAEAVAKILRENVVQGQATEDGSGSYKLRIHEHTERGDNESIKTAGQKNTLTGQQCCSV